MDTKSQVTDRKNESVSAPGKTAEQTKSPAAEAPGKPVLAEKPAVDAKPAVDDKPAIDDKPGTDEVKVEKLDETDAPLIDLDAALSILATSKSRSSGGSKIRPNVGYTLVAEKMGALKGTNVPEQEQVMVKIILNALTKNRPVISEPELHKLVLAAHKSGALKSKQDPWHIFRYYRTDLTKRGVLKQVEFAQAA